MTSGDVPPKPASIIAEPVAIGASDMLAGAQLVSAYKLDAFHTFSQSVLGFADDAVFYHGMSMAIQFAPRLAS